MCSISVGDISFTLCCLMYVLFYWHNVTPLLLDCSHNISDELFCESLHTRMHVVELWQFSCSQTQSGCRRYSVKTAISFSKKHGFRFRFKADQCVYICWWFWLSECHLCRCESVTSAYLMVRSSLCPYVYICCHHMTVLLRAAGVARPQMHAVLTPTTRGIRAALNADGQPT